MVPAPYVVVAGIRYTNPSITYHQQNCVSFDFLLMRIPNFVHEVESTKGHPCFNTRLKRHKIYTKNTECRYPSLTRFKLLMSICL